MGYYTNAQVCENGHLIVSSVKHGPAECKEFCPGCGTPTLTECPACGQAIQGAYVRDEGPFDLLPFERPLYCHACGAAFPWTQRALDAAAGIVEDEDLLDEGEKARLKESLPDLLAENPGTQLAVLRLRKAISKVGKFTADALRRFVVEYGCEPARRLLQG